MRFVFAIMTEIYCLLGKWRDALPIYRVKAQTWCTIIHAKYYLNDRITFPIIIIIICYQYYYFKIIYLLIYKYCLLTVRWLRTVSSTTTWVTVHYRYRMSDRGKIPSSLEGWGSTGGGAIPQWGLRLPHRIRQTFWFDRRVPCDFQVQSRRSYKTSWCKQTCSQGLSMWAELNTIAANIRLLLQRKS